MIQSPVKTARVTDTIRILAYDDLLRAIIQSNNNLLQTCNLSSQHLKNAQDLRKIAQITENSIYVHNGQSLKSYAESVLTLLIFLTDYNLAKDAVLFRLLVNCELVDLFTDLLNSEVLMTELLYSDIKPSIKRHVVEKITDGIGKCIPYIMYDYVNGNHYTHMHTIQYSIPKHYRRKLQQYQDHHKAMIMSKLNIYPIKQDFDALSTVASSISSCLSTISSQIFPVDENPLEDKDNDDLDSLRSSNIPPLSDIEEFEESIRSSSTCTPSLRSLRSSSIQHHSDRDEEYEDSLEEENIETQSIEDDGFESDSLSINSNQAVCRACKSDCPTSDKIWRSVEFSKGIPRQVEFCDSKCMDNWKPKK